ncbi:MAG: hypothetical protein JWN56_39 [Sphingobacteriales bacterium]|nr:hypothetical protein [Sphingobacteriales bacterium]
MEHLSIYLKVIFAIITLCAVFQFYRASQQSKVVLIVLLVWMAAQFGLAYSGFYTNWVALPPRFIFLILPPIIVIVTLFNIPAGKKFIDGLNIKQLTLLHIIRVPVELVLYFLFVANTIPQIMTFEGRNYDIIAGLTAPIIYYFTFIKPKISTKVYIIWNLISLCLLANIVIHAVLSAKSPFQLFGFQQPNIAIAYFPFNWLPSVVVPLVLFCHLVCLRQAFKSKNQAKGISERVIIS